MIYQIVKIDDATDQVEEVTNYNKRDEFIDAAERVYDEAQDNETDKTYLFFINPNGNSIFEEDINGKEITSQRPMC